MYGVLSMARILCKGEGLRYGKKWPRFSGESVRKASTIVKSEVLDILVSVQVVRNILPSR